MSAPKKYDRYQLLDRAIEVFRLHGYTGTSTAELVARLGVNRKSMYAEFGSKQGLFEAALERYSAKHLTAALAPVEAPDAGADAIRQVFSDYACASEGRFSGRGCLMCNTAIERASLDSASGRHVDDFLIRLSDAFGRALVNARNVGEIDSRADLEELAAFFSMALIGVAACVRARAAPEMVHAAARTASRTLDAHRPTVG